MKLISLTAPSGSGKTTLVGKVLHLHKDTKLVTSYTTRKERPSDLFGEYTHVSTKTFSDLHAKDHFLWIAEHGGTYYGTTEDSIRAVFKKNKGSAFMILVPGVIPLLLEFLTKINKLHLYTPVFIVPPSREILEKRLQKRGDTPSDIHTRLNQANTWIDEACTSNIPYKFIHNDDIETALDELLTVVF